jgi:hypothetical protein
VGRPWTSLAVLLPITGRLIAGLAGVGLTAGFFFVVVGLKVLLSWSRYR